MTTDKLTDEITARTIAREQSKDGSRQYVIYSFSAGGHFVDTINMTFDDEEVVWIFENDDQVWP
ncbi:MAG: hypothetical protein MUE72_14075 [Chitinophagaceae bacterium]|jgi:hypothetical protein|nr:hypothetical protein [Chitinophagaceae bacterium]